MHDYLQGIRDDGTALASAAGQGLDPAVLACQGWTVAADGVAELLEVFLAPHAGGSPVGGRGESLHLHATDTEGEWQLRLLPAGIEVAQGHAQGDAAAATQ